MNKNSYMTISEFSKIAEISRKTLIFYDNINLFSPEYTGENGYRYYSHEQIYTISVINILKELGTPLNQIRDFMKMHSPKEAAQLLENQEQLLARKIERLQGIQNMLLSKKQKLDEGICTDTSRVLVIQRKETPLFVSDPFSMRKAEIADEIWLDFYLKCKEKQLAFGYPEGFLVTKDNLLSGKTEIASHIICHVGNAAYANSVMPGGTYLVASGHGGFADTEPIYHRLLQTIQENRMTISGHAYEERLIDEIGALDKAGQVIRVGISVSL